MSRIRIWVPEYLHSESSHLTVDVPIVLEGYFGVELLDAKTQQQKFYSYFPNIITDVGLDSIGAFPINSSLLALGLGQGSTTPTVLDTTLVAPLSPRSINSTGFPDQNTYVDSGSFRYHNWRQTRIFFEDEANGVITELGFFSATTGGRMFNRALIKDSLGSPTSIVKTSNDVLRVTYDLRFYLPSNSDTITTNFTAGSINYSGSIRAVDVPSSTWNINLLDLGSWGTPLFLPYATGTLRDVTASVAGGLGGLGTSQNGTNLTYINGTYRRDIQFSIGPTQAFTASVGIVRCGASFNAGPAFQHVFTPRLVKNTGTTLNLTYRFSWNRGVFVP